LELFIICALPAFLIPALTGFALSKLTGQSTKSSLRNALIGGIAGGISVRQHHKQEQPLLEQM
jgi:VIT1/CCC1 family predicted Fe2+/Mn2+ transporter